MDDARLNQILEETMSILGNQFPGLLDQLQHPPPLSLNIATSMAYDVSNTSFHNNTSFSSRTDQPEEEDTRRQFDIDISNGSMSSFEHALNLRRYQLLENLSSNWFKHGREYHDIMYQMNSISQQLMQSIISETRSVQGSSVHTPLVYPNNNNTRSSNPFIFTTGIDVVGGVSYPLRRVPLFEQLLPDNNNDTSFPNIRQVVSATEIYNYSQGTTNDRNELSCPITLEEFENGEELCRIRFCRHVFKWKYLQEWFCTNSHCPVCRYDIRTYIPPSVM